MDANTALVLSARYWFMVLAKISRKQEELVSKGASALVSKSRLKLITEFAEKVNNNPRGIADEDIKTLQGAGLSDKGDNSINSFGE